MPDALTLFFLVTGLASLISLVLAMRSRYPRRLLLADWSGGVAVGSVLPQGAEDQMWLMYQARGRPAMRIRGAYVFFVRIANFGGASVRRQDIASANPLRIEVRGARVLEVTLANVTSSDCLVAASAPELLGDVTVSKVTFDFLDRGQGALFRILAEGSLAKISVQGTIIEQGPVIVASTIGRPKLRTWLAGALSVGLYALFITAAVAVFRSVTGTLDNLWLLTLPLVVLLVPLAIIGTVATTIWPKGARWNELLRLPPAFAFALDEGLGRYPWGTHIFYEPDSPSAIAFAGKAATGKSTISIAVATELGWSRASFGDYVREAARQRGLDDSRASLQRVGQELVETDCERFVREVLNRAGWDPGSPVIVDGVRHIAVAEALRRILAPADLLLVLVTASDEARALRLFGDRSKVTELQAMDQDPTERDLVDALPRMSDMAVVGTDDVAASKEKVLNRLRRSKTGLS